MTTSLRPLARIIVATMTFGLLAYPIVSNDMVGEETWAHNRIVTATPLVQVPEGILMDQAAAGRTCTADPVLTDHIVFTYTDGVTEVVDFDTALADGKAKRGTVRLYCN